jgi:hypothetical protein
VPRFGRRARGYVNLWRVMVGVALIGAVVLAAVPVLSKASIFCLRRRNRSHL